MSNIAVIAAAGNGQRLNCHHSKMLAKILGKPLLAYTLDQFEQSDKIDEIILIIRSQDSYDIKEEVLERYKYHKLNSVVIGGATRQESVYRGLKTIKKNVCTVCIHDGARPLVKRWMIDKTINTDTEYDGVILAVPIMETMKKVFPQQEMVVGKTVNRNQFWIAQTPQTFKLGCILELHKRAQEDGLVVTDDASIVEHYGGKIKIVSGSRENIKVTTSIDLILAEAIIKKIYDKQDYYSKELCKDKSIFRYRRKIK